MLLDELLVELDRARDRHRQQLVLLRPELVELAPDAEERRHAVALGEQLEEVDAVLVGVLDDLPIAVLLLLRGEVGREEEDLQVAVLVERVGELAELLVDAVERRRSPGRLEQRARVDLGDLLHLARRSLRSPASAEKSTSSSASSIRRRWSSSSSDLRVTFSVATTVRSATSLRISSSARRVSASMSRRVGSISSSRCFVGVGLRLVLQRSAALRARATMSSACSRASFRRARYSASSSSASLLGALGGVDRLLDRLAPLVERLRDAREGELAQEEQRDAERDQRPDHQPETWG